MSDPVKMKYKVTDIALMIYGFSIFSFTYFPNDPEDNYGRAWQLVIFNKKWEHNF